MADEQNETTDLATLGSITGTMTRPEGLTDERTGTEGIDVNEIRLPRLVIAQGLSPQLQETDSKYIDGLKQNDLFNDMTNEVYGRGPLTFVALRYNWVGIEFIPRSEGGGIRDRNVPKGDERLKWTGEEPNRMPPIATEFEEYPSLLLRPGKAPEPILISFKLTNKFNKRAADQMKLFMSMRNAPAYAGLYAISSKSEKNDKGTFGVPVVQNAGFVPKNTPAGKALYDMAEKLSKSFEGKTIVADREPGSDDFDTAAMDASSAKTPKADM